MVVSRVAVIVVVVVVVVVVVLVVSRSILNGYVARRAKRVPSKEKTMFGLPYKGR